MHRFGLRARAGWIYPAQPSTDKQCQLPSYLAAMTKEAGPWQQALHMHRFGLRARAGWIYLHNEWREHKKDSNHPKEAGSSSRHIISAIQQLHILSLPGGRRVEDTPVCPCSIYLTMQLGPAYNQAELQLCVRSLVDSNIGSRHSD